MSQKSTEKKTHDHYHVGEYLWRTTDNALFKITNVALGMIDGDGSDYSSYDLTCVNHAPVKDVTVYLEMVHEQGSIYTIYQPSKPVKGQHVWNIFIDSVCHDKYRHDYHHDKHENEFIVEDVVEKKEDPSDLDPCKKCHNGVCEQCNWGYRPKSEVLAEVSKHRKKPETIITLMNLSGHKVQTITLEQFNASFTMLPPDIYKIDQFVREEIKSIRDNSLGCEESEEKAEKEVDDVMNDKLEKESIDTGTTVDNSYDTWRNNLKVVNVAKFDQEYFQRGLAYHVQKCGYGDGEFYGIMFSVDEDTLKVMKLGEAHINYQYNSELVEIPLKEYMDGRWHIVRLVEEVNK